MTQFPDVEICCVLIKENQRPNILIKNGNGFAQMLSWNGWLTSTFIAFISMIINVYTKLITIVGLTV